MKKINVKKEILTIIMVVVAVLTISSHVFATGSGPIQIDIPQVNTTTNETVPDISGNQTTNQQITNVVTPATNVTGSTYQNQTSLPQTGDASDYAIFMIIVVAVVVAIYAYRKVREYNI